MIEIVGEAAVSLYMDVFALLLILALISLSHRLISGRTYEDKLFLYLCITEAINSVCGIIYSVAKAEEAPASRLVMILSITMGRIAVITLLFLWILYVDYRLNRSMDHLIRRYPVLLVPVAVIVILLIINLFTGILFTVDETYTVDHTILYHCLFVVNIVFFAISTAVFFRYKRSVGSLSFFSIMPFTFPVIAGAVGEFLCFYASEATGIAIGLVFMYFSMLTCWQFEDSDPAFYNPTYLGYVCDCLKNGKSPVKCAVSFSSKNTEALAKVLKKALPKQHETVHLADDRFLYLSSRLNTNYLDGLTGLVSLAAKEYDAAHPDDPMLLEEKLIFPPEGKQDKSGWLEVFLDNKEV